MTNCNGASHSAFVFHKMQRAMDHRSLLRVRNRKNDVNSISILVLRINRYVPTSMFKNPTSSMNAAPTTVLPNPTPTDVGTNDSPSLLNWVSELSHQELLNFNAYLPDDLSHYAQQQKAWLERCITLLQTQLHRRPNAIEIANQILTTDDSRRFRAYYALCFPERVTLDPDTLFELNSSRMRIHLDS